MNTKPLILCVDDEVIVLNSLQNQLRNYFDSEIIVEGAESGEEALEVIEEFIDEYGEPPHLIISDQIMPKMKGDELLAKVHEKYPLMLKILLTGQADKEDIIRVINSAQLYRYIEKPWEIMDLGLTVKEAIKLYQKTRKIEEQREELINLNKTLEAKVKERTLALRQKNEELLAGIRYAQKIQESILPDFNEIKKNFSDGFLYYKPLGILSGDFFWYAQIKEKIIVSACDCTGHGVPGAIMSVIGNNLLNEIILLKGVTNTKQILHELNEGVHTILHQHYSGIEDGMDISLCCINLEENTLEFSGAKNPLVYFENNELKMIKADRWSIGGLMEVEKNWSSEKIDLEHISHIYMFSDGYQDQFGGDENKKFSPARLRQTLTEIHELPMHEQESKLNEIYEAWKGNELQVDDIMIMGIALK